MTQLSLTLLSVQQQTAQLNQMCTHLFAATVSEPFFDWLPGDGCSSVTSILLLPPSEVFSLASCC